jgi:2',3'-cyclic-nucleotide 2'-phosphodiesterase (5'-nucleotidase family)
MTKPSTHLRIVAVSDVYSLENLPRLATLIAAARAGCDHLVVAVPGDFLAPSVLSSLDNGRGMVACLNALGVTHVTFGNHEDDVPHRALLARMSELNAIWLASNVQLPERPLPDHDILELDGVRVGMFGVVLADPVMFRGRPFLAKLDDPRAVALREVAQLTGELGCSWVIALTHQDIEADRDLARDLAGSPVIVIGSHEHVSFDETVAGIRVLKAGADAERAIVVDAVWDDPAIAPTVTARLESVVGYAEDAEQRALVERHMAPVHALATATLLELAPGEQLSSVGMRASATSIGTLVCTRIRDVLGVDACVFNAGGIRGARDYRDRFTYGDLEAELPFDNEVVTIAMPGSVIRDAVATSRAHAPAETGAFLQVDDQIVVDGTRVVAIAGARLEPDRRYRVALVRELCFGLDRIEPLVAFARAHPEAVPAPGNAQTPKQLLVRSFVGALWRQLGGFAALDADHDGRVVPAEVAAALERAHPGTSPLVAELVVGALDIDHDGAVSAEEERDLERAPARGTSSDKPND